MALRVKWDSVFSDLAEHLVQVGCLVGKHVPISPVSCPLQTNHGEHALRPHCLLDTEWKSLTWNPETGMGGGGGAEATLDPAHHHILQKEPRDSWKLPVIRSWAGFQLVPWRREVSYPITSLLSQPVPPGLRSYKHQPVLRGDLPRPLPPH